MKVQECKASVKRILATMKNTVMLADTKKAYGNLAYIMMAEAGFSEREIKHVLDVLYTHTVYDFLNKNKSIIKGEFNERTKSQ